MSYILMRHWRSWIYVYLVIRLADAQGCHCYIGMSGITVAIPIWFLIKACITITWDVCVPTTILKRKDVFYYNFGSKYLQNESIFTDNKWVNEIRVQVTEFLYAEKST
jgi:hypothetical protein